MITDLSFRYTVDERLRAALARAERRPLENALRRITRARAKPALDAVRRLTPVVSGKLAKSWHLVTYTTPSKGEVGVRIAPREEFVLRDRQGVKRLVTNQKASRRIDQARAAGHQIDRQSTVYYALPIETGKYADGTTARRKGGAKMLARGLTATSATFMQDVASDVFAFLTTTST